MAPTPRQQEHEHTWLSRLLTTLLAFLVALALPLLVVLLVLYGTQPA